MAPTDAAASGSVCAFDLQMLSVEMQQVASGEGRPNIGRGETRGETYKKP